MSNEYLDIAMAMEKVLKQAMKKVLKQEISKILGQIRNEIENVTPKAKFQTGKTSVNMQMMIPQEKVLQIIDKYKS